VQSEIEEYIEMMKEYHVFQEGPYDVRYVAQGWKDAGFAVDEAESWIEEGCYLPHYAVELRSLGVTSEQAAKEVTLKGTIAFFFSRHVITAKNIGEYLKEPEKRSLPKPQVAVVDENGSPL